MLKILSIFIWISGAAVLNQAQLVFVEEYKQSCDFFVTDPIDNLYLINDSELKKINLSNQKINRYSNTLFGNFSAVDVSDPFKILIYNKDFNKLVFLDQTLTEITDPVFLDQLNLFHIGAICKSNEGGFWVFDLSLYQLKYYNEDLKNTRKSVQLAEIIETNTEQKEIFVLEKNDYIYLGIEGQGVLQFDKYGTYLKTFPLSNCNSFQVVDKHIIYYNNGSLISYHTTSFKTDTLVLPGENIINARVNKNKVFLHTSEKVMVYKTTNL